MPIDPRRAFVRSVWFNVPSEDDVSWVRRISMLPPAPKEPLGDYGALVKRMLDCGLTEHEIARFAKLVGYETAHGIMYLLADPSAGFPEINNPENVAWTLYQIDPKTEAPIEPLSGLHEDMLELDPSGREMRPRSQD